MGPQHPDLATALGNLALVYRDQGKFAQAERLYRRALAIRERSLGADHVLVADSLDALAETLRSNAQQVEAQELRKRAKNIRENRRP